MPVLVEFEAKQEIPSFVTIQPATRHLSRTQLATKMPVLPLSFRPHIAPLSTQAASGQSRYRLSACSIIITLNGSHAAGLYLCWWSSRFTVARIFVSVGYYKHFTQSVSMVDLAGEDYPARPFQQVQYGGEVVARRIARAGVCLPLFEGRNRCCGWVFYRGYRNGLYSNRTGVRHNATPYLWLVLQCLSRRCAGYWPRSLGVSAVLVPKRR